MFSTISDICWDVVRQKIKEYTVRKLVFTLPRGMSYQTTVTCLKQITTENVVRK